MVSLYASETGLNLNNFQLRSRPRNDQRFSMLCEKGKVLIGLWRSLLTNMGPCAHFVCWSKVSTDFYGSLLQGSYSLQLFMRHTHWSHSVIEFIYPYFCVWNGYFLLWENWHRLFGSKVKQIIILLTVTNSIFSIDQFQLDSKLTIFYKILLNELTSRYLIWVINISIVS